MGLFSLGLFSLLRKPVKALYGTTCKGLHSTALSIRLQGSEEGFLTARLARRCGLSARLCKAALKESIKAYIEIRLWELSIYRAFCSIV